MGVSKKGERSGICTAVHLSDNVKPPPSQSYDSWHNDEAAAAARRQLEEDGTGPFAVNGQGYVLAFLKDEATLKSDEFRALPQPSSVTLKSPLYRHTR